MCNHLYIHQSCQQEEKGSGNQYYHSSIVVSESMYGITFHVMASFIAGAAHAESPCSN